ncbi:posphoenolpyruvate synthetase regulatory kinase/phosphorylase PpsR [Basilea psittacipulmonis]|uniref:Putative phosphoenolpyruvate synthase regulatory protein n=1 Tax=Basilea psittacipulmonis DSM 24701 TaxID=1072685 RepID=A0A077DGW7_9BURK|nr:pyruvate, water dikinase regulatory protein [Basilea psittacipulmonis]AIL32682.1 PEP synthetase regulatory protein [Basilea psittacipulmonis DSM 24701]
MSTTLPQRTVFIVSDSTGITAETFSNSVLTQFISDFDFKQAREPYITTVEKAKEVFYAIKEAHIADNAKPIVFSTLVDHELQNIIKEAPCIFLDIFGSCVQQLSNALEVSPKRVVGRSHLDAESAAYRKRMDAINFTLAHDDGQFVHGLDQADVILVGVSRCGKTPTSLYLAMQYGLKVANFPLIPEDFERGTLPSTLHPFKDKLFGLSINPERLSQIREERRPNSKYASIVQCVMEVEAAEDMMKQEGIEWLSTTTRSVEEISTTVLHILGLDRNMKKTLSV